MRHLYKASRTYKVIDENGVSIVAFDTKEEAEKVAKRMSDYHGRTFTAKKIEDWEKLSFV